MESFDLLVAQVKEYCKERINPTSYVVFFEKTEALKWESDTNTAYLEAPSAFQQDVIKKRYIDIIEEGFLSILGFEVKVDVLAAKEEEESAAPSNGNYALTFDNFIKGDSNSLAFAAAMAISRKPAADRNNPLFIYGDSGLGKTHLLTAICIETKQNFPDFNIVMVDGESFTNEYIYAVQNNQFSHFHQKYREADMLLIDDIQFIGGKEQTQGEFFHTFNTLQRSGKQIVLVSDRPPKEIRSLSDRLQTRFLSGLIVDIQPPKYETRVAIVKRKAELLNLNLPDDVVEFLANKLQNNIRQLEGAVKKLNAYKKLEGIDPSLTAAHNAIKDILNEIQPVPVTIEKVLSEVSRTMGVTPDDIRSSSRKAAVSNARKMCMYIVQQVTSLTTTEIGEEFGGRDHSTVVYSIQDTERKINRDRQLRTVVDDIIKNVKGAF